MNSLTATKSIPVDVTLADWTFPGGSLRPCGIHVDAATTIVGQLADGTLGSWVLTPGASPYCFLKITTASSPTAGIRILLGTSGFIGKSMAARMQEGGSF